jgi:hypothetical protein
MKEESTAASRNGALICKSAKCKGRFEEWIPVQAIPFFYMYYFFSAKHMLLLGCFTHLGLSLEALPPFLPSLLKPALKLCYTDFHTMLLFVEHPLSGEIDASI